MNESGTSRILAPIRFVVILPFSPQCFNVQSHMLVEVIYS